MSVSEENLDSASEIRYSKKNSLSLAQNVDLVLKMSDEEALRSKKEGDFVSIMKTTPSVIAENVEDAELLEIIMRFDAFYLATRKSGVLEGHYHDYGETMKRLPEILSSPLAIVRMDNKRLNLFAVVPHDKGDNNIISLELNTVKDINSKNDKYNLIVTVTPGTDNYVRNTLLKHGIKVEYKKEDLTQVNHQLYEWLATINDRSSNISILDSSEKVNSEVKYSRKTVPESISEGNIHKRVAEWEKLKVYEKRDAEKMINGILTSVLPPPNLFQTANHLVTKPPQSKFRSSAAASVQRTPRMTPNFRLFDA